MLTDAGSDDAIVRGVVPELLEHELRLEQITRFGLHIGERELLLPTADRRLPCRAIGLLVRSPEDLERVDHFGDHQTTVAGDADIGTTNLAQFGRIDVHVDDLGVGSEAIELAGDAVVETGAEGDQQIGLLHRGDGGVVAVHAGHAETERMIVGHRTAGHEGGDDRDVEHLGQCQQGFGGTGFEDATTGVEHRSLGGEDQASGSFDEFGITVETGVVTGEVDRVGPVPIQGRIRIGRVDEILRDVDEHGAGTTGGGDVERLADDARDVLGPGHKLVVLGDRAGDADRVDFLEGIGADAGGADLTGDDDHRNRVHVGVGQRRDDIGGGRAAGDHGHAGTAGGMGIALGHVARTLFMTDEDVPDRGIDDRVVHRQDRSTG
ncbi:unannotated protein [freshwater metagenome]|uniref:Unannotated protein n=1 Tax=freshwater metagenome TaxID=449393 RepID=A0A6J7ERP0_9ZZZZ